MGEVADVGNEAIGAKNTIENKTADVINDLEEEITGTCDPDDGGMWNKDGHLSQAELMDAVLSLNTFSQANAAIDSAVAKNEGAKVNITREIKVG